MNEIKEQLIKNYEEAFNTIDPTEEEVNEALKFVDLVLSEIAETTHRKYSYGKSAMDLSIAFDFEEGLDHVSSEIFSISSDVIESDLAND